MADRKKKIAFYCGSLAKGGTERKIVNLAEYFVQKDYAVTIITQYKHEDEYQISDTIERVISDITFQEQGKSRLINFLKRFIKLRKIFCKVNPDVTFSCFGKNNLMAIATNFFRKNKVIVSVVADPNKEYATKQMRVLAKMLFAFADGVVLQTKMTKSFFPKYIRKKAIILPNPLNPLFIRPRYDGIRNKEIVAVGRLDDNKNHAMLIKAFSKIKSEFPEYKVIIYGEGEERNHLLELIDKLGLSDRVFLPGKTNAIQENIYASSLFVLTSDTEGMPNALMEAMALGLPVIATDCPCGGPAELIIDGVNGYLVPVRDEEALEKRMRYCLSHTVESDKIGRKAMEIQNSLNPQQVNRKWEQYFIQIMS